MRKDPLTGQDVPWRWNRGRGCGPSNATPGAFFVRSGAMGIYDLRADFGMANYGGLRSGCSGNIIAAGGLLLAPVGDSGCGCGYDMSVSLALAPVNRQEDWGAMWLDEPKGRIVRLAVNLGAPGDRRDSAGTLWLSSSLGGQRGIGHLFQPGCRWGGFARIAGGEYRLNADATAVAGTDRPWIYCSGLEGLASVTLPLVPAGAAACISRNSAPRSPANASST
jgi:hypothetical protein